MNFSRVNNLILELRSKSNLSAEETELIKELQFLLKLVNRNNFSLSVASDACKCCGKKFS